MHVEPPCEQGVASTDRTWGASSGGAWSLRRFALTLRSSSSGVWLIPTIDIAGKVLASQLPCVVQCRALAGDLGERGGLGCRPQSSSPSSVKISRLRGRSAIGVTVAGSVASICQ